MRRNIALLTALALAVAPIAPVSEANAEPTSKVSHEPFFAGLVKSAHSLHNETAGFAAKPSLAMLSQPMFTAYAERVRALSAGDLKGHYALRDRGTDNDLKCILLGVSRDLTIKLDAITAAKTDADLGKAFGNMRDLLSDNIEVIVTPATADSGLDCVIEFGKGA